MKKYFYLLVAAICVGFSSMAAPGDTTWVQANNCDLPYFGSYDSTIVFPPAGKSYRSIYMIFTLGKYMCPSGSTYCGDWDYTVLNYLITPNGQSYEIGRFITPYANAGAPRTPWAWKQHYVYDVTDYAPLLHDTAKMRIFFSGYSGGFTGNIRFAFIEGAPDREVVGIRRLWTGSYSYGDTSHLGTRDINLHFLPVTDTAPENTKSAELKFTVTGHGSDPNFCNEFCSHNYYVFLNGSIIDSYKIWRPDCGLNELYPQSGTWVYERANWCPGAIVYSEHHKLPGVIAGSTPTVGLQFEPYIGNGGASYTTEGTLFYYGAMKKTLDASIDHIIAPTNDENYFRENPICGSPVIHVKNRGLASIGTISFQYGLKDSAMQTYTWSGTLNTFDETDVTLPKLKPLSTIAGDTGTFTFVVKILKVNGETDADSTNNILTSHFFSAPNWPSTFIVAMRTNSETISATSNVSETSWAIYDMNNTIVKKRANAAINTTYTDSVSLPTGYYKLVIYDSSCDGLQWWANPSGGSGYLNVRKTTGGLIPMNGYNYSGTYNNDFGCGFTQYFYMTGTPNAITNVSDAGVGIEAYPNPALNSVSVDVSGLQEVKGTIHVIDALGRVVATTPCNSIHTQVDLSSLASGVYTILFLNETSGNKLTTRLLIAK